MSKPKTRFVLTVNGVKKEVISVRDRSGSGLLFMCQGGRNSEFWGESKRIVEDHFSVHPGDQGSGVTIKRTTAVEDGNLVEHATFVPRVGGSMATPLYTKASQDLRLEEYDLIARPRDRIINLGSMDATKEMFVFGLAVSTTDWPMEDISIPQLHSTAVEFDRFKLGIISGCVSVPSTPMGYYTHFSTSLPRVNGEDPMQCQVLRQWLPSPAEVSDLMQGLLAATVSVQLCRVADFFGDHYPELRDWLLSQAQIFRF